MERCALAQNSDEVKPDEEDKTIVVGLVKRVLSKGTRLVLTDGPPGEVGNELNTTLRLPKSNSVSIHTKVMKKPLEKGQSLKTMSDFKV